MIATNEPGHAGWRPRPAAALVLLVGLVLLFPGGDGVVAAPPPAPSPGPSAGAGMEVVPNDPLYGLLQGYLQVVNAPAVWSRQTGDAAVLVAVIDDGLDVTHPDLAPNIWQNPRAGDGACGEDLHGCSLLDAAASTTCATRAAVRTPDISPTGWHGTYLAGVIGAAGNNALGIAGVAWRVSLMGVRVADCRHQAETTALVNAIHYAVDRGARVIDVGVTSGRAAGDGCKPSARVVADAVQYARDHGALVIAGAGDNGRGCVADPGAVDGALAVGGFGLPDGGRWHTSRTGPSSNWGAEIGVAAPAGEVAGTVPRRAGQTPPNDLYAASSGTAAAAAIVTGEAALLLSQNALLTPDWLITLIELGAHRQPNGDTPGWAGAGTVDLAASLGLVPAGFAGRLTIAGEPAPDGTPVKAYVGGVLCAQAAGFAINGDSGYALFVPVAAMQPGCGAPGAGVELRVGGSAAAFAIWNPTATALDIDLADRPLEQLPR